MIEIKNLVKTFKSKRKDECVALNNLSFTLPDKGFVFIVGKSGSGKTTLLSLIGTLDNISSGDIIVDGISLKNISESDASFYRNERVGFIYQDYHLIEELTVLENIKVALNLNEIDEDNLILESLKKVGLEGYASRFPRELSGGEKQRVAIARAIIKNPSIILADEPTGNLDTVTSRNILNLLEELSKDRLVLIVSHDLVSAKNYASKIIKLNNGNIKGIYKRNNECLREIKIIDDILYLPANKIINEEEQKLIDTHFTSLKGIKQINNEFIKDEDKLTTLPKVSPLKKEHFKVKDSFKLGMRFLKNNLKVILAYSILLMCFINVIALTETISNYPKREMIMLNMKNNKQNSLSLVTKTHRSDKEVIPSEVINKLKSLPLEGNMAIEYCNGYYNSTPLSHNLYSATGLGLGGTIISNEDFLINKYGKNGQIDLVAKNPVQIDYGIYLTDFVADMFIEQYNYSFKSYEDFFEPYLFESFYSFRHGHCNGIINTNYKTKYKDVLKYYEKGYIKPFTPKELFESQLYKNFEEEYSNYLVKLYSTNPDHINKLIESDALDWTRPQYSDFKYNNKVVEVSPIYSGRNNELVDNQIIVSSDVYNSLTGIELTKENFETMFKPIEVSISFFDNKDDSNFRINKGILNTRIVNVVLNGWHNDIIVSKELIKKIQRINFTPMAIHFDNINDTNKVLDISDECNLEVCTQSNIVYNKLSETILTFGDLFNLIEIVLFIGFTLILVIFSLRSIKEEYHNIGILKSLGTRNKDLSIIFSFKVIAVCLLTTLLYLSTTNGFFMLADKILYKSINRFTHTVVQGNIKLLIVDNLNILINIGIIVGVSLLSIICEYIKLHKIKPINIMKAKE